MLFGEITLRAIAGQDRMRSPGHFRSINGHIKAKTKKFSSAFLCHFGPEDEQRLKKDPRCFSALI